MVKISKDSTIKRIFRSWEERQTQEAQAKSKPWNAKGWRAHLGGSVAGRECARQIWFSWRWAYPVSFPGRVLRLFDTGHREEPRLVADLEAAGALVMEADPVTGEQFRVSAFGGHFGGSLDSLILGLVEAPASWHLGEFKTSNDRGFKAMERDGVQKAKPEHHSQMQVYMGEWNRELAAIRKRANEEGLESLEFSELARLKIGRLERAFYLMRNKNDDALYQQRIDFDSGHHKAIMQKVWGILTSETPPERISETPTFYKCKWCDFADVCFSWMPSADAAFASRNCRTCMHSTPNLEGEGAEWMCESDGYAHPIGEPASQFEGCEDHLFNPGLMPSEPVAVDSEHTPPRWVAYPFGERRLINATERGHRDATGWIAALEFEEGLTAGEALNRMGADQVVATSEQLAERKVIEITQAGAFLNLNHTGGADADHC